MKTNAVRRAKDIKNEREFHGGKVVKKEETQALRKWLAMLESLLWKGFGK